MWRGILDYILLLLLLLLLYFYFFFFFFFFSGMCDYIKERPVLLLLFPSLSLSPFDWTFGTWSVCLLFCFVCFELML